MPAGFSLGQPGVFLGDADGDGRLDLIVDAPPVSGFFPLDAEAVAGPLFRPFRTAPGFSLRDPEVRLVDLDGDGAADFLHAEIRFDCFFQDGAGWSRRRSVERGPLAAFPDVSFSDPRVRQADLSGDGLQDIVLISEGAVDYWPNIGHGDWGPRISMRRPPRLPAGTDPQRLLLGDVDGDGLADLLLVENGRVHLWVNQGGAAWSNPVVIAGTPVVTDLDSVRLVDLLGVGIAGILWSFGAGVAARHSITSWSGADGRAQALSARSDRQSPRRRHRDRV